MQCGIDAETDANGESKDSGEQGQFEGCRQALGDEGRDLAGLPVGDTELASRSVGKEARKLDWHGLIEPEPPRRFRAVGERRLLAHHVADWVADIAEHRKGDEPHRQHHEDGLCQAADDEGEHDAIPDACSTTLPRTGPGDVHRGRALAQSVAADHVLLKDTSLIQMTLSGWTFMSSCAFIPQAFTWLWMTM